MMIALQGGGCIYYYQVEVVVVVVHALGVGKGQGQGDYDGGGGRCANRTTRLQEAAHAAMAVAMAAADGEETAAAGGRRRRVRGGRGRAWDIWELVGQRDGMDGTGRDGEMGKENVTINQGKGGKQ